MAVPAVDSSAAQGPDPRAERERVRSEQADVAADLNALEASNAEVTAALDDLEANVAGQQALLADAERAADQAGADVARARTEEERAVAEVTALEGRVRDVAVETFMRPVRDDPTKVLAAASVSDAARRSALLRFRADRDDALLDELRAGREDVALRRQAAEEAASRAEQERAELAERVGTLEAARAQQQQFAASVEQRLDATLAEAASLAALDRQLADQIAAEQVRIAAQLNATRVAQPSPGRAPGGARPAQVASGSIVSVRGIRVHASMASQLEGILAAADADGVVLSGGGYRDPSAQVALRRAHCGGSDYATYEMSPSQCSPPTARPGSSMHERGLAIDFTYNGSLISSRSNPGFGWLAANAERFGLYNLPSEPWHWSTNG
ncbi:MAG: D-alanyl-D-alanine carboxypeptidase family protein, partial [Acidimicrobiales bacterium]